MFDAPGRNDGVERQPSVGEAKQVAEGEKYYFHGYIIS